MLTSVDMSLGYYTDFVGIVVCIITAYLNMWRFKSRNKRNNILLALLACVLLSCICNSLGIFVDGRPGSFFRLLNYITNTWLFMACIINGILWLMFIEDDIHGENSQVHIRTIQTISIVGLLILVINLHIPMIFTVNGNNVYERGSIFFLYFGIQICFLLDAIAMYMIAKYRFGGLSVISIWAYLLPLVTGMVVQYMVYGLSLIWPSAAVSTCVLFAQINSEDKYKDRMTGLYRYDFIPVLGNKLNSYRNKKYTIILLQVLGLGTIKAEHGIEAEDEARVDIAKILEKSVKPKGIICQSENDAYIVVFNTTDEKVATECIDTVKREFREYKMEKKMDFSLDALMGSGILDVENEDIEERIEDLRKLL